MLLKEFVIFHIFDLWQFIFVFVNMGPYGSKSFKFQKQLQ